MAPLEVKWNSGTKSGKPGTEPAIQVYRHDERTWILRQSKTLSYEAPFMFLLLGDDRALLLDTGATEDPASFPLRETVDSLIGAECELVVAHTHGHGDHVAGDGQFADRPKTTVVDREGEVVRQFFGFTEWPAQTVTFDLGGRVLEVLGSPGHHRAAVTIFDPRTGFLLTGDTVYRGRLYTEDYPAFVSSLERMVDFAERRPVTHVVGCHIEMSTRPGRDYPIWTVYQPQEPPLELSVADLRRVRDAAIEVKSRRGMHHYADFIIFNDPTQWQLRRFVWRGKAARLRQALRARVA